MKGLCHALLCAPLLVATLLASPGALAKQDADTSDLRGHQLRPPNGYLKVRRSMPLQVRFCLRQHIGELAGFVHECATTGESDDLAPLMRVSSWSVNGIVGGNSKVGRISGIGAGATYTAPAEIPDPASVAVSAEVALPEGGKTLVVSNITILDDVPTYIGPVTVTIDGDGFYLKSAGVIALQQHAAGSDNYYSTGGRLEVQYQSDECSPYQGVLPLAGELSLNIPKDDWHSLVLFSDAFEVPCHGISVPNGLLMTIASCEAGVGGARNAADSFELNGTASCAGLRYSWQLTRE